MKPTSLALSAFMAIALTSAASATGMYTCDSGDKSGWKSMEELKAKMIADGWSVRRIKEDGGCYEAYGTTPEGDRVEAYFHPAAQPDVFPV